MVARDGIEESGKWLVFGCRNSSGILGYRESYPGDFLVIFGIEPPTAGLSERPSCAILRTHFIVRKKMREKATAAIQGTRMA